MPKQPATGFVFAQLALSAKALRLEEERWEDLEEHCHDPRTFAELRAQRDTCEDQQDTLLDYLLRQAEALDNTRDAWALSTLKNEPSVGDLKIRPIRRTKAPTVSAVTA
jgi:hypothetical protein